MQLANITFDAEDPRRLADFWSQATGWAIEQSETFFAILTSGPNGPRMLFLKVPEPKTAKNRVHVDFKSADRQAEVARLVSLVAAPHETRNEFGIEWTVLTDPEGNEFCVARE